LEDRQTGKHEKGMSPKNSFKKLKNSGNNGRFCACAATQLPKEKDEQKGI